MKIAYILSADPFEENGVNKKVKSQVDAWKSLRNEVQIFSVLVNEGKYRKENYLNAKIYLRKRIFFLPRSFKKDITDFNSDIVYLRFEVFKPLHFSILKNFNTIVEINTDDIVKFKLLADKSIREKIRIFYHLITRWIIFKYVKGIISVTYQLLSITYMNIYKKSSLVVSNSLILKDFKIIKKCRNKIPQLVVMGTSDYPWYVIDKITEFAKRTKNDFFFHIIGNNGSNYPKFINVIFHGYLFREEFGIHLQTPILVYHGSINEIRGIYTIIDAIETINNVAVIFMGRGKDILNLKNYIKKKNLENRVFVKDAVHPNRVLEYISSADIGIQLFHYTFNHYTVISNKLLECIMAWLAIIANDYPEMKRIVVGDELGEVVDYKDMNQVRLAINRIINDKDIMEKYKGNSKKVRYNYSWENEEKKLLSILDELNE